MSSNQYLLQTAVISGDVAFSTVFQHLIPVESRFGPKIFGNWMRMPRKMMDGTRLDLCFASELQASLLSQLIQAQRQENLAPEACMCSQQHPLVLSDCHAVCMH